MGIASVSLVPENVDHDLSDLALQRSAASRAVRVSAVHRARTRLARGCYDDPAVLDAALDRLIADVLDRG